jgi:hypothetical protein
LAFRKLAQGGLAIGETLAVVGDNPSGKEAIIPFERHGRNFWTWQAAAQCGL